MDADARDGRVRCHQVDGKGAMSIARLRLSIPYPFRTISTRPMTKATGARIHRFRLASDA